MDEELKMEFKQQAKKELCIEMLVDELYKGLKKSSKGKIKFETYCVNTENVLYLLKKYDSEKFEEYAKMILKVEEEE